MSKLKPCPSCQKEVAKSAKLCPGCGKKLKSGMFFKLVVAAIGVLGLAAIFGPSTEEKAAAQAKEIDTISSAQASSISATGELAEIFQLGTSSTDIQRDKKEKEISGQIVQWNLEVYEVRKISENKYKVQTSSNTSTSTVGTFVTLHTRSPEEIAFVESLKTGSQISIKGKIDGTTMRNIDINPAILLSR